MVAPDAIVQIAVNVPLRKLLSYRVPCNMSLKPGMRVKVQVKSRMCIGLVVAPGKIEDSGKIIIKPVIEQLDQEPLLNEPLMELLAWCAKYYLHPPGEVFMSALPTVLRRGGKCPEVVTVPPITTNTMVDSMVCLNESQEQAVQAISADRSYLLEGVTGSGKTEVYIAVIAKILQEGGQVLLLLPEIGLTPQNLKRLQQRFQCPVAVIHSGVTERQKLQSWQAARNGLAPLVVGTRSALWTPLCKPGLILVDEEHDTSFKQQEGFRYMARDVAIVRARIEKVPVVLGSATPSLESVLNARRGLYVHLRLPYRAGKAKLPAMTTVDLRHCRMHGAVAEPLVQKIRDTLQRQRQVLLFLGRRGYSPVLLCRKCSYREICNSCDATMTLHSKPEPAMLRCHHCGRSRTLPPKCPECNGSMVNIGYGTQRIEETLQRLFPETTILRFDRDRVRRKGELQNLLNQAHSEEPCIIVGTQMIAKGHNLTSLDLVGVLDVDRALYSHNFRSMEIAAQQIIQVSGRAGRGSAAGQVVLQTRHPEHPFIQMLLRDGYPGFTRNTLNDREAAELPPFTRMALLQAESREAGVAHDFLQSAIQLMPPHHGIACFGPFPTVIEKKANYIREQIILTAPRSGVLQRVLHNWLPKIDSIHRTSALRWFLDVDPVESY